MDKRNTVEIDPKTEANNMYKHIVCEALYSPNALPVHLSEPFNINVEFIRISSDWLDLELLDKNQQTIDKIKLNTISSIEPNLNNNNNNPLNNSSGSSSPMLTRSNSILNRGVLGSNSSSDDLLSSSSSSIGSGTGTISKSSKATALLGIEEANNKDNGSPNKNSKASALLGLEESASNKKSDSKGSAMLSPKFGLLARSASNNLLKVNEQPLSPTLISSSPANSSFLVSSSPLSISSSPVLSSSTGSGSGSGSTLNISPSNISSPRSGIDLSSSPGMLSSSSGGGSGSSLSISQSIGNSSLHYNQNFTIISSSKNFTFNAADKDSLYHILNSVKMLSNGRPYQDQLQQTFDAIAEAITISQQCKIPQIPPLPSPPPPPPTILLLNNSNNNNN